MSGTSQTIGVDVFKELINQMKTEIKSDFGIKLTNLDSTMGTRHHTMDTKLSNLSTLSTDMGTKLDSINAHMNNQDLRIRDLGQRVETLEKHIATYPITYSEAAKSPPKPQQSMPKVNTTLSTTNST